MISSRFKCAKPDRSGHHEPLNFVRLAGIAAQVAEAIDAIEHLRPDALGRSFHGGKVGVNIGKDGEASHLSVPDRLGGPDEGAHDFAVESKPVRIRSRVSAIFGPRAI